MQRLLFCIDQPECMRPRGYELKLDITGWDSDSFTQALDGAFNTTQHNANVLFCTLYLWTGHNIIVSSHVEIFNFLM